MTTINTIKDLYDYLEEILEKNPELEERHVWMDNDEHLSRIHSTYLDFENDLILSV